MEPSARAVLTSSTVLICILCAGCGGSVDAHDLKRRVEAIKTSSDEEEVFLALRRSNVRYALEFLDAKHDPMPAGHTSEFSVLRIVWSDGESIDTTIIDRKHLRILMGD